MLYFIVNTTSRTGYGAGAWYKLREELKSNGVDYRAYETKYAGHAGELAKKISNLEDEDICIVVVGGDGTINEVLNGIEHMDRIRFAAIPNGSGNDFGRGMKLDENPVRNLRQILDAVNRGKEYNKPVDIGKVSWMGDQSRLFAISSGIGLDAIVCKRALTSRLKKVLNALHLGKLTYLLLTVHTLFSMETAEVSLETIKQDGTSIQKQLHKMIFMAAMNLSAEGGGVPMAPKASCTDGQLSVCSASGIPKWNTFLYLPFLVAAKHEKIHGFWVEDVKAIKIKLSRPMTLHTDGEYCGEADELRFECLKGKLRYLM